MHTGENHGTCEDTGKQHGRIPQYKGSGMYEKCGSERESSYPCFVCFGYNINKLCAKIQNDRLESYMFEVKTV